MALGTWMMEKMRVACYESYTNLQGKLQNHHAFEAEVSTKV